MADLTADDVWSDWKAYMTDFGYTMSGVERQTSAGLVVSGVSMGIPIPDADGQLNVVMGDLNFVEQSDGSVLIETDDTWRMEIDGEDEDARDISATVTYTQTAPRLVVSGSPEAMNYDYYAARAVMSVEDLKVENAAVGSDIFAMEIVIDDIATSTQMTIDQMRSYEQTLSSAKISYDLKFKAPEENSSFDMRGEALGLTFTGAGDIPEGVSTENASALIAAGFAFAGTYDYESGSSTTSVEDPSGGFTSNSTSQGGTLGISMSDAGLSYQTEARGLAVNALMSTFPLPVSMEIQKVVFDMLIPTVKGQDAQDFGMQVSLSDVSIADALWGLFDPSGQLPRDPATLNIDLSGKAKLLFDYLDPAQATILEQSDAAPGELESLDIKTLELDVAGARLTGAGDFAFDNADTATFNGMPRPEGAVNFTLTGGNGLLDKLVTMGLVPEDQAMGARMMMGLFARPGDNPDELLSTIEINDQGHIMANGQRIR